jgi:hypothetical protein
MYSTRLGYRSLRKGVSISPVDFQTRVLRIHTGSVPSPAKIDGSGFCSVDMRGICVGMRAPFQGSHGRQLTSRQTLSVHLDDRSSLGIWSLQKAQSNLQKAAFIVKPYHAARKLRLEFTTCSPAPCQRRTSHYATCIDSTQLSQFRRRNKRLTLSAGSRNVAFYGILRLLLDVQSSFVYLTFKAALCYNAHNEKDWS